MSNVPIQNAPTNLNMIEVQAQLSKYGGLAKNARYYVRILPSGTDSILNQIGYAPFMSELSYLVEGAEMPGRGYMNADVRYYGPSFKLPFQTQYEDVTFTFLCRSESFERQFFDDWMEIINPTNSFDFSYRDQYRCEIQVYQLTEYDRGDNNPDATYQFTLHNAWPTLVNPQPVTWADDNIQRLAVMFTYTKWTRRGRDRDVGSIDRLIENGNVVSEGGTTITRPRTL